jgi:ubiquinone/menaquinone biosynthesis C-methylase UbiE
VPEELAIQAAERLEPTAAVDIIRENIVELVAAKSVWAIEDSRSYEHPREDTASPLEYAFHLLDTVRGRTVVDLGCGSGLHTVILARLGAQLLSIDSSASNLNLTRQRARAHAAANRVTLVHSVGPAIPMADAAADLVLCSGILQHTDPVNVARQIRRILKPGGRAVFQEVRPAKFGGRRMTKTYALALSRAVGIPGRLREFWLTTQWLRLLGVPCSSSIAKASQRLDAAVFRRFPLTRLLASTFVWEARKEI